MQTTDKPLTQTEIEKLRELAKAQAEQIREHRETIRELTQLLREMRLEMRLHEG